MPIRDNTVFQRKDVKDRLAILKLDKISNKQFIPDRYGNPIVEFTDDELLGILNESDRATVLRLAQLEEFAKPCSMAFKVVNGAWGEKNKYRITIRSDRTQRWDTRDFDCESVDNSGNPQLELLKHVHTMKLAVGEESEMPKVRKEDVEESRVKSNPDCPVHKVGMVWNPAIVHFVCQIEECKIVAKSKHKPKEPVTPADVSSDLDDISVLPSGPVRVVMRGAGQSMKVLLESGGVFMDVTNFVIDLNTTQEVIDVSSFSDVAIGMSSKIPGRKTLKLTMEFLA